MNVHEQLAQSHPKISPGIVWCVKCQTTRHVDPERCLATGWPTCCGQAMTIDSPEERAGSNP